MPGQLSARWRRVAAEVDRQEWWPSQRTDDAARHGRERGPRQSERPAPRRESVGSASLFFARAEARALHAPPVFFAWAEAHALHAPPVFFAWAEAHALQITAPACGSPTE